jgi:hypothetical protein
MNLISVVVGLVHSKAVEIAGYMVGGPRVGVPLTVYTGRGSKGSVALLGRQVLLIPVPVGFVQMTNLEAELALGSR